MLTWIGRSVLLGLLLAQTAEPSLEQEYRRAIGSSTDHALVTLIAHHEDGTPLRGFIQCAGWWQKYQDRITDEEPVFYKQLPFRTDARGAVIMNPRIEDQWIFCWAEDKGKRGSVTVHLEDQPTQVVTIILNNEGP